MIGERHSNDESSLDVTTLHILSIEDNRCETKSEDSLVLFDVVKGVTTSFSNVFGRDLVLDRRCSSRGIFTKIKSQFSHTASVFHFRT